MKKLFCDRCEKECDSFKHYFEVQDGFHSGYDGHTRTANMEEIRIKAYNRDYHGTRDYCRDCTIELVKVLIKSLEKKNEAR